MARRTQEEGQAERLCQLLGGSIGCWTSEQFSAEREYSPAADEQSTAQDPNDDWLESLGLLNSTSYIWPPDFSLHTGQPVAEGSSNGLAQGMDARLVTALQQQSARIEESLTGDLELFYYRFVSLGASAK